MRLQRNQKFQCLLKREQQRNCQTKQFVSALISSPNGAAGLVCRVTRSPIGLKRSDNCSPRLVPAELRG